MPRNSNRKYTPRQVKTKNFKTKAHLEYQLGENKKYPKSRRRQDKKQSISKTCSKEKKRKNRSKIYK